MGTRLYQWHLDINNYNIQFLKDVIIIYIQTDDF